MKYDDAINKIFNKYTLDFYENSFLLMSLISDEIGNDFQSKISLNCLYKIVQKVDVITIIKSNNLVASRKELETVFYNNFKGSLSSKEYVAALNPLCKLYHPEEFKSLEKPKANKVTNNVLVQKRPVKLPKPKVIKKIFEDIYINFSGATLVISNTTKKKPEVYVNGKLDLNAIDDNSIKNNELNLMLRKRTSSVELKLPIKKYNKLNIFTNNDVCFKDQIEAKNIKIYSDGGMLKISAISEELNVITNKPCFIFGIYGKTIIKSDAGEIYLMLKDIVYQKTLIDIDMIKDDCEIEFCNIRFKPAVTPIFHANNNIHTMRTFANKEIYFELNSKEGRFKVR